MADLVVERVDSTGATQRIDIVLTNLSEDKHEIVQSTLQRTRTTIAAQIALIAMDKGNGLLGTLLAKTALGRLRGTVDSTTPLRSQYVAIIYDVKCSGEATHRPNLRIPPLQREKGAGTLKPLIEAARGRHPPRLASGDAAPDDSLDVGDLYLLLDGGMTGNMAALMKPFQGKERASKSLTIIKEQASVDARHERVRGVGNIRQTETMILVSQVPLNLPPQKYKTYWGSTGGEIIGPVVLPPAERQWCTTWATKKLVLGADQLIEVGGKLEVDAPEHKRKKQRVDDTIEPVFFHSLPERFWLEVLEAFNIIGVIDLCAGEGTCALAAYRKLVPYVGICFTEQHAARLHAHLEKTILGCMTTATDPLYDVRFATAVTVADADATRTPTPTPMKRTPKPKPPPPSPGEDPIGDEPPVSGDD
jgi:hypothetical protein